MGMYYTTAGKQVIAARINGAAAGTDYIQAGTGAGAASVASTALSSPVPEAQVATVRSQPTPDTDQWKATQTYGANRTITNWGVFTAAGVLLLIQDGISTPVLAGQAIDYTWQLQQT